MKYFLFVANLFCALSASAVEKRSLSEIPFFNVEGIQMGMAEGLFAKMHADASKQVGVDTNTYVIKKSVLIWYSFVFSGKKLKTVRIFGPTKVSPPSVPPDLTYAEQMEITEKWVTDLKAASNGRSEEIELGRIKNGHPHPTKGFSYTLSQFGAHTKAVLESSSIQLIVTFFDTKLMGDVRRLRKFGPLAKL
jgi:hypothetical protein